MKELLINRVMCKNFVVKSQLRIYGVNDCHNFINIFLNLLRPVLQSIWTSFICLRLYQ